jgi:hypothetical protein
MKMLNYFYQYNVVEHHPIAERLPAYTKGRKEPSELKLTPWQFENLHQDQVAAIEHAVNNHDALVDMLTRMASEVQFEFSSDVALMEESIKLLIGLGIDNDNWESYK